MKYVIHNVKDSCWNILGNMYTVNVTDPLISATMKPEDYKVRESESDPWPKDFIEKKFFQAKGRNHKKYLKYEGFAHDEVLKEIFEWISNDIWSRGSLESFTIQSHIYL